MAKPMTLWIAIADGEHARIVRPDGEALRTVRALDSAAAHRRSRDIGSDRPGRSFESANVAHHALAPKQDPHQLEEGRFVNFVAELLNDARDEFDALLLVAPPRALQNLREALDDGTRKKLVGSLEKDLVKTPDHDLWPHVREWVTPDRTRPT